MPIPDRGPCAICPAGSLGSTYAQPQFLSVCWTPTAQGPIVASREVEVHLPGASRAHEDGVRLEAMAGSSPRSQLLVPRDALRVTRCDEEEDTKPGSGPGWAAPVSLLGSWPLRQVQETDRHDQDEWATAGPQRLTPGAQWRGGTTGRPQQLGQGGTGAKGDQLLTSPHQLASSLHGPRDPTPQTLPQSGQFLW